MGEEGRDRVREGGSGRVVWCFSHRPYPQHLRPPAPPVITFWHPAEPGTLAPPPSLHAVSGAPHSSQSTVAAAAAASLTLGTAHSALPAAALLVHKDLFV